MEPNPYVNYVCESGLPLVDKSDVIRSDDFLVVAPQHNTPGKHDATGAFHPGAHAFLAAHDLPASRLFYIDARHERGRYKVADDFLSLIEAERPKVLVCFCHGYTHGIQFGIRSGGARNPTVGDQNRWRRFCDLLGHQVNPVVVLYACSTGDDPDGDPDTAPGSGDDSFSDRLRDALCHRWHIWCRVFAHTTAGHSWFNPMIKIFDGNGAFGGGFGGELLFETSQQRAKLQNLLKTDWAFRMPFKPIKEIRQEIS